VAQDLAVGGVVVHHQHAAAREARARRRDRRGLTLALDVMSVVALAHGEHRRGGRLFGAARQLQRVSGTGLADWDARIFQLIRLNVHSIFTAEQLEPVASEGATLSMSDAVAYALEARDPFTAT